MELNGPIADAMRAWIIFDPAVYWRVRCLDRAHSVYLDRLVDRRTVKAHFACFRHQWLSDDRFIAGYYLPNGKLHGAYTKTKKGAIICGFHVGDEHLYKHRLLTSMCMYITQSQYLAHRFDGSQIGYQQRMHKLTKGSLYCYGLNCSFDYTQGELMITEIQRGLTNGYELYLYTSRGSPLLIRYKRSWFYQLCEEMLALWQMYEEVVTEEVLPIMYVERGWKLCSFQSDDPPEYQPDLPLPAPPL